MEDIESVVARFRNTGLKITPQRVAIFRYLQKNHQHPCAEDIFRNIQRNYPSISFTTVYKTLEVLRDLGEVNEIYISGERKFFDSNTLPHNHLICTKCHRIFDIPEYFKGRPKLHEPGKIKFQVTHYRLDFFGYCGRCKRSV